MKFTLWEKSIFFQMLDAIPRAGLGEGRIIMKCMDGFEPTEAEDKILQDNRKIDTALANGRDLSVEDKDNPLPDVEQVDKALDKNQLIKTEKKYILQAVKILNRGDLDLMFPWGKRYRKRTVLLEEKLQALIKQTESNGKSG